MVTVAPGVRLEVLDWGGPARGRPVVLLAGAGDNAHVFDAFAPALIDRYHVYGITRRGFAPSTVTTTGFLADSLADDVLTVLDSLRLARPVLVGHSIAGEELSSIGSRHPERVAGVVYLDAVFPFSYYDSAQTSWSLAALDAQRKLLRLVDPAVRMSVADRRAAIADLVGVTLPLVARDLRAWERTLATRPNQSAVPPASEADPVLRALALGHQEYTTVRAPALAIVALPLEPPPAMAGTPEGRARSDSLSIAILGPQFDAFERGVPGARVVRLPHANHYIFRSNPDDVLREVRAFVDRLPASR